MIELNVGIKGEAVTMVDKKITAQEMGSGGIAVLATPALVALMENAAFNSVQGLLDEGLTTVGTMIDIKHLAATPEGVEVVAKSELVEVDGKKLVFRVEAFDNKDKVAEGMHHRFIVATEKFLAKVNSKK